MTGRAAKTLLSLALLALVAGGCAPRNHFAVPSVQPVAASDAAAVARAEQTIQQLYPPQYRAIQRAIVTTGGKQFTCDGLLQTSPATGLHLAIVSSFGVVTEVRVQPDGSMELLKVTPLFREDWSRRFVARDLRWLFLPPASLTPAGRLADGSLVLQTTPDAAGVIARYTFSPDGARWLELDLWHAGKSFYRAVPKNFHPFAGAAHELPGSFAVTAGAYRLELRIAEMIITKAEGQP